MRTKEERMNKLSEAFTDADLVEVNGPVMGTIGMDFNNVPTRTIYQELINGQWVEIKQYETVKSEL